MAILVWISCKRFLRLVLLDYSLIFALSLADTENATYLNFAAIGDVVINSTAPGFDCGKLLFNERTYRVESGKTFTCNGVTVVRGESLALRLLSSNCYFLVALAIGVWSMV